jgi:hypothetical protein
LQLVASVRSDDLGEYRFGKLTAGRYYIRVRPPGDMPGGDYLPTWYPAAAAEQDASPVELKEGQEAASLDIHLSREGGARLSGRVTLPAGFRPAQANLRVYLESFLETMGGPSFPIAADGTFVVRHAVPGTYVLTASIGDPPNSFVPPRYLAVRTIVVSRENIDGIALNVVETPVRELRGTVAIEGCMPQEVQVGMYRLLSNLNATAKREADGSFVFSGLWPGRYRLNAGVADGQATSLRLGGQEIPNCLRCGGGQRCFEFDFDGTQAPLQITVAKTVRISGRVTGADAKPVFGAGLILVPVGGAYEPGPNGNLALAALTQETGGFTAMPVLPGLYRVYVVDNGADAEQTMADPGFLKSQEKAFPPLRIVAGENPPLKLVLPSR